MASVIHTVDVVYGSYSQEGYTLRCDENDDLETVKGRVRRELRLNFLSMATYSVKIRDTKYLNDEPDDD